MNSSENGRAVPGKTVTNEHYEKRKEEVTEASGTITILSIDDAIGA